MNRRPSRPVIVAFPFAGSLVGGSHMSAAKLIQSLDRRRYQPVVVLHQLEGPLADMLREAGIAFEPAPSERYLDGNSLRRDAGFVVSQTLRFARFLRQRGVRIVHTNDGFSHATWALPTRLAGARLLWHHRKDPDAKGLRYLAPWAADRVVSVSQFAAPKPGLFSSACKATVVHSPFDTDAPAVDRTSARLSLLEELGCEPGTRVIGFFGNLMARKRPLLFVDTIAEMRARAPDLRLAAPIFGEDRQELSEAIRARALARGVADCVHIMGFRYPPEQWLAGCEVLLVPAVDEPFGRTLIEAMLLGTVVAAAASGGNLEAIRDGVTGCLVPPDDAAAFAERTLALLAAPRLTTSLADAARQDVLGRFGLREHAEAIMRVYDTMLSASPAAAGAPGGAESARSPDQNRGLPDEGAATPHSLQVTP
ncbi:MAG TPA: glycosyltransferase family 4 protein [Geminicoccaceae bacterium]|nr:glycosyltransferase family 4 protein [Geminicoccaceae bacterium]